MIDVQIDVERVLRQRSNADGEHDQACRDGQPLVRASWRWQLSQCSGTADQHETERRIRHHGGLARHDRDERVQTQGVAKQPDCSKRRTRNTEPQPGATHEPHHECRASAVCIRARSSSTTAGCSMSITGVGSYNS